jgi:RHS repeat-associated protein
MLGDGSHSYSYDAENRLISVDSTSASYTYDALGHRVQKTIGAAATQYVYDQLGRVLMEMQGSTITNAYAYLNGRLLAEYTGGTSGTTEFVHQDHLGSTRLLTNVSGCIEDNLDYRPFGFLYSYTALCTSADTTHKFTGQERDTESDLDNFVARYYSSAQGRFMSPDPLGGNIGDPQKPEPLCLRAE